MRHHLLVACAALLAACVVEATDECEIEERADGSQVITCDGKSAAVTAGSCTVRENADGSATITCPDGTSTDVADGDGCSVRDNGDGTKTLTCDDGTEAVIGAPANDVCTVAPHGDGTLLLTCPDGTTTVIPYDACDGGVRGGDFTDVVGWSVAGGARVDAEAGVLDMGTEAMCSSEGTLAQQRVCVPPFDDAGALRMRLDAGIRGCLDVECSASGPAIFLGGQRVWWGAVGPTGWATTWLCLGEKHYGRAFDLEVRRGQHTAASCPERSQEYELDTFALEVAPDGACPAPGTIFNGGFDLDGGKGWTIDTARGSGEWVFDGTDREARLFGAAGTCSFPRLDGFISVPSEPIEYVALEFTAKGVKDTKLSVWLGDHPMVEVTAKGKEQAVRLWIDPTSYGYALPLTLSASNWDNATSTCEQAYDWTIDDIRFVSDPACAEAP